MDKAVKNSDTPAIIVYLKLALYCVIATAYLAAVFSICKIVWNYIV